LQSKNLGTDVWTDPDCAARWSDDPTIGNPNRVEHLDMLMALLTDLYQPGQTLLDVGIGSGLVEALIFEQLPNARIVGLDSSEAMVALARERLSSYQDRYDIVFRDLMKHNENPIPKQPFQIAFSVQTIHNIPDQNKVAAFKMLFNALSPDGWFFLIDRFAVSQPQLFGCYKSAWQRLSRLHNAHINEQDTYEDHLSYVAANGDLPATVEQHLVWLREVGFLAECLHLHANRGFLIARKPS